MKKTYVIVLILSCLAAISACGEKSFDAASTMPVAFKNSGFQPPPRGVDDIIELLQKPSGDAAELGNARKLADAKVPSINDKHELGVFYFERGEARRRFGREYEARDDYARAVGMLESATHNANWFFDAIVELYKSELRLGRIKSAIDVIKKVEEIAPSWNAATIMYFHVSRLIADMEKAEKYKKKHFSEIHSLTGYKYNLRVARLNGQLLDSKGKHKKAEPLLREALSQSQYYAGRNQMLWEYRVSCDLASNLLSQAKCVEAEMLARQNAKISSQLFGNQSMETIERVLLLVRILVKQRKVKQAVELINVNFSMMKEYGVHDQSPIMLSHNYELGSILLEQGSPEQSYDYFKSILDINQDLDNRNQYITNTDLQTCMLQMGQANAVKVFLADGYHLAVKNYGTAHLKTALLAGLLGVAYNQLGDRDKAYQYFSKSIPIIRANPGRVDQTRKTILEGYLDLLHWIQEKGQQDKYKVNPMNESFMAADMMRTKSTSYALNQSLVRTKSSDPGLGKLVRDEQDLEMQIKAYWGSLAKLASAPKGQEMPELASRLRGTISDLQAQRKGIRQEIEDRYPKYGALVNPPAQGFDAIRALFAPGESLIAIHPGLHRTYLWAGAKSGKTKFIVVELGRKELDGMVSKLKSSLTRPNITTYRDIPAYDFGTAHALYTKLLKPLADIWQGNSKITLLVDGSLGELPFEVLITKSYRPSPDQMVLFGSYRKAPWLANQATITRLPAASSLLALRQTKAAKGAKRMFAGFGNPVFSQGQAAAPKAKPVKTAGLDTRSAKVQIRGVRLTKQGAIETTNLSMHQIEQLSALPDTEDEIKSVARALKADPKQDLFLGKKASERVVKTTKLDNRKVLAFATHALLPGDLSGLDQSALALSSPRVTGENEDGLLTMGEVMTLKLASDLVILSGCSTGAASSRGAEAISGLGRAFFYAGSKGVMVTMWPVETASAGKLVTSVFEYKKDSLSQSLNAAKLNMIQKGGVIDQSGNLIISYAHPIFWAPYVFVGDANTNTWK